MHDPVYEDSAIKFWEHFLHIVGAMNRTVDGAGIWTIEDGFYYDVIHVSDGEHIPLKIRSLVGLIPLFAVQTLDPPTAGACSKCHAKESSGTSTIVPSLLLRSPV